MAEIIDWFEKKEIKYLIGIVLFQAKVGRGPESVEGDLWLIGWQAHMIQTKIVTR